jgi:hypothetical protein
MHRKFCAINYSFVVLQNLQRYDQLITKNNATVLLCKIDVCISCWFTRFTLHALTSAHKLHQIMIIDPGYVHICLSTLDMYIHFITLHLLIPDVKLTVQVFILDFL